MHGSACITNTCKGISGQVEDQSKENQIRKRYALKEKRKKEKKFEKRKMKKKIENLIFQFFPPAE